MSELIGLETMHWILPDPIARAIEMYANSADGVRATKKIHTLDPATSNCQMILRSIGSALGASYAGAVDDKNAPNPLKGNAPLKQSTTAQRTSPRS